jgi:septum formation protein
MRLVLASASPRRAELLTTAGIAFDVLPSDVDETVRPHETPSAYALRVARDKAAVAVRGHGQPAAILAADTVVVAGEDILGKPADDAEAQQMLTRLSGTVHVVQTAVVLIIDGGRGPGESEEEVVSSRVSFVPLSTAEIEWYVSTGEPRGKAGGYAIQGLASRYVDWIEGSWSNVVGLPVATVYRMLRRAGVLS